MQGAEWVGVVALLPHAAAAAGTGFVSLGIDRRMAMRRSDRAVDWC